MWIVYARAPVPNAPYWPGRRLLALLDAILWPGLIAATVISSPVPTGVVGPLTLVLCALFAARRCGRAVWRNERYQFTTWHCGVPLVALLAVGAALKLVA